MGQYDSEVKEMFELADRDRLFHSQLIELQIAYGVA